MSRACEALLQRKQLFRSCLYYELSVGLFLFNFALENYKEDTCTRKDLEPLAIHYRWDMKSLPETFAFLTCPPESILIIRIDVTPDSSRILFQLGRGPVAPTRLLLSDSRLVPQVHRPSHQDA